MFIRRYLIPRLIQYVLVIFFGVTAVFIIPRLLPNDPVLRTIGELRARGASLEPGAMDKIIADMTQMYGLEGSWLEQYGAFWARLVRGDLGVSFFQFPTPVNALIGTALPWTIGLLLTTTILAWVVGNMLGAFAGYFSSSRWSQGMDAVAMVIRPDALLHFRLCPASALCLRGALVSRLRRRPWACSRAFTWPFIQRCALALVFACALHRDPGHGGLVSDHETGGAERRRRKLCPICQVERRHRKQDRHALCLSQRPAAADYGAGALAGSDFQRRLITEIVFSYPGLGSLLYRAIVNGDYNLIMGITLFSIFAITTTVLIVDLLYPLLRSADQIFVNRGA
jgi:peptide/nickel transport system permease protein